MNTIQDTLIDYEILDHTNPELIAETAKCLSETFIGYEAKGQIIREPMCYAIKLEKEDFDLFVLEYLQSIVEQGFCFIAKDSQTGKVIGTLACEIFDPSIEEVPVFEGSFEPFNRIMELLMDLDERFMKALEKRMGRKPSNNEYIHAFMLGIKSEKDRKEIALNLMNLALKTAEEKDFIGCFTEATSFKSQTIVKKYFDFYVVSDLDNQPIITTYAETEAFSAIPESIAKDCQLLYRPLNGSQRI